MGRVSRARHIGTQVGYESVSGATKPHPPLPCSSWYTQCPAPVFLLAAQFLAWLPAQQTTRKHLRASTRMKVLYFMNQLTFASMISAARAATKPLSSSSSWSASSNRMTVISHRLAPAAKTQVKAVHTVIRLLKWIVRDGLGRKREGKQARAGRQSKQHH